MFGIFGSYNDFTNWLNPQSQEEAHRAYNERVSLQLARQAAIARMQISANIILGMGIINDNKSHLQKAIHNRYTVVKKKKAKTARRKAFRLLMQNLTLEQRRKYKKNKTIIVTGNDTKTQYRLDYSNYFNVNVLDKQGRAVKRLCAQPMGRMPIEDIMLAQKLMLETLETKFINKANVM